MALVVTYYQNLGGVMAYLEFIGEDEQRGVEESAKFWEVTQDGKNLHIHFGRIGTKGQNQDKSFDSAEAAIAEMDKLVKYLPNITIPSGDTGSITESCGERST